MEWREEIEAMGRLFYVVSPNRTTFSDIEEVPEYGLQSLRHLTTLFFLELLVSAYLRKPYVRVNETIANLSQILLLELTGIFAPAGQLALYVSVYSSWRIADLPCSWFSTWWLGFLAIDFAYYWLHRAVHEINFLWVLHEVHHSSEDYNLSVNQRQSLLQSFALWPVFVVLYLPMAVVLPPPIFLVHFELNQIYQHWIHTEVIRTMGPLEYVLITPSHHRVHHGSNRRYIDKNFGGTLVIWDKLFGSFEPETEQSVYGVTEPAGTFEPLSITFGGLVRLLRRFWSMEGWKNKVWVLLKGPGWAPGKPRLGDPDDIPEKRLPYKKYDPLLSTWEKVYVTWHFFLLFQASQTLTEDYDTLSTLDFLMGFTYVVASLVSIGLFLDQSMFSPMLEASRCMLFFMTDLLCQYSSSESTLASLQARWLPEYLIRVSLASSFVVVLLNLGRELRCKTKRC